MYYNNQMELLPEFESILLNETLGIIGKDTRKRINDTSVAPFKYICSIRIGTDFDNPEAFGTGFLIGPKTVMTAGHVVHGYEAGKLWIVPGRNILKREHNPFGIYAATEIIMSHPLYSVADNASPKDYAIIQLNEDVSSTIGHWGKKPWKGDGLGSSFLTGKYLPESAGIQKINICGYPRDKGRNTQYLSYNKTLKFNKDRNELYFLNDITYGNSGSPIWVRRSIDNGGRVLVGITTYVDPVSSYNAGVFLNEEVRAFMKTNTI